jgi:hypothetical protein
MTLVVSGYQKENVTNLVIFNSYNKNSQIPNQVNLNLHTLVKTVLPTNINWDQLIKFSPDEMNNLVKEYKNISPLEGLTKIIYAKAFEKIFIGNKNKNTIEEIDSEFYVALKKFEDILMEEEIIKIEYPYKNSSFFNDMTSKLYHIKNRASDKIWSCPLVLDKKIYYTQVSSTLQYNSDHKSIVESFLRSEEGKEAKKWLIENDDKLLLEIYIKLIKKCIKTTEVESIKEIINNIENSFIKNKWEEMKVSLFSTSSGSGLELPEKICLYDLNIVSKDILNVSYEEIVDYMAKANAENIHYLVMGLNKFEVSVWQNGGKILKTLYGNGGCGDTKSKYEALEYIYKNVPIEDSNIKDIEFFMDMMKKRNSKKTSSYDYDHMNTFLSPLYEEYVMTKNMLNVPEQKTNKKSLKF